LLFFKTLLRMGHHHVYVLASGGGEGWGAAKAMVRHGENGLLFASGRWKTLGTLVSEVNRDEDLCISLVQEAQRTVTRTWSPEVAAEWFVSVCESLLANRPVSSFNDEPTSLAWN
jgi:predicted membrane GTPase involved in stress response